MVDVVQRPDSDAPDAFPGLYLGVLPAQPFMGPTTLLVTSQWRSSTDIVHIDLDTGAAQSLRPADSRGAWALLTIGHGVQMQLPAHFYSPPWIILSSALTSYCWPSKVAGRMGACPPMLVNGSCLPLH